MSDQDAKTPRVILVRHGETEWAKTGRFTGNTDISLNPTGRAQVSSASSVLFGPGCIIDPSRLARIIVSPRTRAIETLKLLLPNDTVAEAKVMDDIREWDYGEYEGMTDAEIRIARKGQGLDSEREWSIWTDGCPGGESMQEITKRLDRVISEIRTIQSPRMKSGEPADVLLSRAVISSAAADPEGPQVAHGLILRCFWKRWLGLDVDHAIDMKLPPAGVAVMSYHANDIKSPDFYAGLSLGLPLPAEQQRSK